MPMSFEYIPASTLLPLFYAEVRPAPEPYSATLRMLLIGHQNKGGANYNEGTALENTLYLITREESRELFGPGSQLSHMYERARENFPWAEIWAMAIPEAQTVTRAKGAITVVKDASPNKLGLIRFWIGGRPTEILIRSGDTKASIATKIKNAINVGQTDTDPSTGSDLTCVCNNDDAATPDAAKKLIVCKWAGITGNEIRITYIGPSGRASDSSPVVKLSRYYLNFTQLNGGTGEAETAQSFTAIGAKPFDVFVFPYATQNLLDKCQEFMDGAAGRWSPFQQLYGHMFTAQIANHDALIALGEARNDPHMTIMGIMQSIQPSWEWSSALAAIACQHWANPPELSRPLQTLVLRGISVGSDDDDSFTDLERQMLLEQGISTFHVNPDTSCAIDRVRTTRKFNAWGDPDPSWADAITMFQAMFFVKSLRAAITSAFPRSALANNDRGVTGVASPSLIKMVVIHDYIRLENLMLVENSDIFVRALVVERDAVDRNRVNILARPDLVNQLRVVATIVETHLELDPTSPLLQLAA
jgi:phage tail sheath gpL-like